MGIRVQQRNSVEAGLESFFNLHPTEDLNELFDALREIDPSHTWIVHTDVWQMFSNREDRSGSETERMALWMNPGSREVFGEYVSRISYNKPIDPERPPEMIMNDMGVEEDISRTYPVVLTSDGIRVPESIEIDDDMRKRIENFRLVVQLIDLSEESRGAMDIEGAAQAQNQMTTGTPTFHIGYNLDDEHPLLLTIREQFNIPAEYAFNRTHTNGNLVFNGGTIEPWHLTPGSNDNTRWFEFSFLSLEEELGGTTITSSMQVTDRPQVQRTEAEVIHERLEDSEIDQVEMIEENEWSLND